MTIQKKLFELQDKDYALFHSKLIPTVPPEKIIGVRTPEIRKLAKTIYKENSYATFLKELPHEFYDENMLHGLLISEIKSYDNCISELEKFLPYVDNWAVCDTMSPKVFRNNRELLLSKIREWTASEHTYTCRFGIEMLMSHFLDENFKAEYNEIPAAVRSEEYYVNMMVAWYFATALAKQWEDTLPYLLNRRLDQWTHNKTIQKAIESYRITPEQKDYLRTLMIKG